jgi:hypothetical protein
MSQLNSNYKTLRVDNQSQIVVYRGIHGWLDSEVKVWDLLNLNSMSRKNST